MILIVISFQYQFLPNGHVKSSLRRSVYLAPLRALIETLLAFPPIDNIVMTQIVSDCYFAKC